MQTKPAKVLYVDDEEMNLYLFKASFQPKYAVITALSAKEALNQLDSADNDIFIVISDMKMPHMNGVDFIKKAKEKHKDVAYFILTGFEYTEEIDDAVNDNIILNCFHKPFDISEIEVAIDQALGNLN